MTTHSHSLQALTLYLQRATINGKETHSEAREEGVGAGSGPERAADTAAEIHVRGGLRGPRRERPWEPDRLVSEDLGKSWASSWDLFQRQEDTDDTVSTGSWETVKRVSIYDVYDTARVVKLVHVPKAHGVAEGAVLCPNHNAEK